MSVVKELECQAVPSQGTAVLWRSESPGGFLIKPVIKFFDVLKCPRVASEDKQSKTGLPPPPATTKCKIQES